MDAALKPLADHREPGSTARRTAMNRSLAARIQGRLSSLEAQTIALLYWGSTVALRLTLGIVFFWFGALKVFGVSPAAPLVKQTYSFLPFHPFFLLLGVWEMAIGCGLICRIGLRFALLLLCIHLAGTFSAIWLAPRLFFLNGNLACLTIEGEFVVKNLVLIAAGLVVAGHELRPLGPRRRPQLVRKGGPQ